MTLTEAQVNAELRKLQKLEKRVYAASELREELLDTLRPHFVPMLEGAGEDEVLWTSPQYTVRKHRGHLQFLANAAALRAEVDAQRELTNTAAEEEAEE